MPQSRQVMKLKCRLLPLSSRCDKTQKRASFTLKLAPGWTEVKLDFSDGSGAGTFVAGFNLELNTVAFVQILEPVALD